MVIIISNFQSISNDQFSNRKDVKGFTNGYVINDQIKSKETNFYRAKIKFSPMSEGEFFIEAFGKNTDLQTGSTVLRDNGANDVVAYGHLDPWYSSSWSYRRQIVIDHSEVTNVADPSTTYADFPVYVHATGLSNINANGTDIRFTDLSGTELPREIESYAGGTLDAWVKFTLTKDAGDTSDDLIYMYYGNASATEPLTNSTYGSENVWDNNFVMVQHLQEDPGPGGAEDIVDSTQYDNDGTAEASMLTGDQVAGQIDGSLDFDGGDDYVALLYSPSYLISDDFSISFWLNTTESPVGERVNYIGSIKEAGENDPAILITQNPIVGTANKITIFVRDLNGLNTGWVSGTTTINDGVLHLVTFVRNTTDDKFRLYVDGGSDELNLIDPITGNIDLSSTPYYIGAYNNKGAASGFSECLIDEVRISNTARSANWISTEYANQNSSSTFLTINAEEDNTPTKFVSSIMQSGGDYSGLSAWETALAPTGQTTDLTATGTRVFSGSITGTLSADYAVELYRGGVDTGIDGNVVAHTADGQILIDGITGISYELVAQNGDQWRYNDLTDNMWTITGTTGNDLGDSAIAVAKIDGAWTVADETAVTIADWTTSATNYIKVYTTETARHDGKWDESKYRLSFTPTANNQIILYIYEDYVRTEGLQIYLETSDYSSIDSFNYRGGGEFRCSKNMIISEDATESRYAINIDSASGVVKIWNNIIYDCGIGIYYDWGSVISGIVYNNTVVDSDDWGIIVRGSADNNNIYVKNNLVQGAVTNYSLQNIEGSANNLAEDTTSPNNEHDNKTVNFADEANDDFHLAPSDTSARDAGTDLSADSNLSFSTDIDGEPRPGHGTWDIGADEFKRSTMINTPHTNKWTDGLVGYWSFDGQDMDWGSFSAEAIDRSGQGNDGDVRYGPAPVIGISGQVLSFDNINNSSHVRIAQPTPDDFDFTSSDSFSAFTWFKKTTICDSVDNSNEVFITRYGTSHTANTWWFGCSITTNALTINFYPLTGGGSCAGVGWCLSSPGAINDGQWHYGGWVYNGSTKDLYLYLDGVVADSVTTTFSGTFDSTYPICIGGYDPGCNSFEFNGLLDEVRIYNRALSADEIAEQYRVGARKFQVNTPITDKLTDGLVGHWTFNGEDMDWAQTTAEARDTSGNNNHGDVKNGAKAAIGKVGQGLDFDGEDDVVEIAHSDSINLDGYTDNYTVSIWVNSNAPTPGTRTARLMIKRGGSNDYPFNLEPPSSNDNIFAYIYDGSNNPSVSFGDVWDGAWHCLTFVVDNSADELYAYMDGGLVDTATNTITSSTVNTDILGIGDRYVGGRAYDGLIDEVRIYNRALSADEIGQLYRIGARKMGL